MRFRNSFTGNAMGDYLLGYVADFQLSNVWVVNQRHWASMFYVQDDWKVNSKLTLNLGLRYDFITPALEASNAQTNFNPAGGGSLVFAKDGSLEERGLVKADKNNFAPRVGMVYTLNEKTVLRGGSGIFYNLFDRVGSEDQLALNLPGLINNVGDPDLRLAACSSCKNGIPGELPRRAEPRSRGRSAPDQAHPRGDQDAPKTTINQASFGFQRELMKGIVLNARLRLDQGHEPRLPGQPQPAAAERGRQQRPRRPALSRTSASSSGAPRTASPSTRASTSASRSASRTATASASPTRSATRKDRHLRAALHPGLERASRRTPATSSAWYGPSDYDVRHRLAINFVVELPFGKGKKWATDGFGAALLGDWTVSGIYTYRSGRPFTVNQSGNNVGTNMTGLPNHVGDPETASTGAATRDRLRGGGALVQPGRVPGGDLRHLRQREAQPAARAGLQEPRLHPAAPDQRLEARRRRSCAGTCSTSSTPRTSACPTATSPTPPTWARSPASAAIRASMQLSVRLTF